MTYFNDNFKNGFEKNAAWYSNPGEKFKGGMRAFKRFGKGLMDKTKLQSGKAKAYNASIGKNNPKIKEAIQKASKDKTYTTNA